MGTPKSPRTCIRCGRAGHSAFELVDRYADGSEEWRCQRYHECARRVLAAQAARGVKLVGGRGRLPRGRSPSTGDGGDCR